MRAGTRRGGRCEEAGGGAAGRGQQNGDECPKTKAGRAGRQELVQAQHGTEHWACRGLAHAPDRHAELACDVRSRCLSLGRKES
jgi:hypothetical protein